MISYATVLALHQAVQLLARPDAATPWLMVPHLGAIALAVRRPRLAMGAVAVLGAVQCAIAFPRTATHQWLGVVVSLLFCLLGSDEVALRRAALALPLIVFAWSGVQKLVHGYWFHSELLAWMIVSRPDVTLPVAPLLDSATAAHLGSLARDAEGSGPFRLGGVWAVLSNAVWLVELGAPLAALSRHAWALLLGLTWAIQLFAHEWQFGLLLSIVLLCAAPERVRRPGFIAVSAALVLLAIARLAGVEVSPELVR